MTSPRLLKAKASERVPVKFAVHLLDDETFAWLRKKVREELGYMNADSPKARRRKKYKQLVYLADAISQLYEERGNL